jgi:hypothetical protein
MQIPTRTIVQIRTHAQKYFQKLAKEEGIDSASTVFRGPYGMTATSSSALQAASDTQHRKMSSRLAQKRERSIAAEEAESANLANAVRLHADSRRFDTEASDSDAHEREEAFGGASAGHAPASSGPQRFSGPNAAAASLLTPGPSHPRPHSLSIKRPRVEPEDYEGYGSMQSSQHAYGYYPQQHPYAPHPHPHALPHPHVAVYHQQAAASHLPSGLMGYDHWPPAKKIRTAKGPVGVVRRKLEAPTPRAVEAAASLAALASLCAGLAPAANEEEHEQSDNAETYSEVEHSEDDGSGSGSAGEAAYGLADDAEGEAEAAAGAEVEGEAEVEGYYEESTSGGSGEYEEEADHDNDQTTGTNSPLSVV